MTTPLSAPQGMRAIPILVPERLDYESAGLIKAFAEEMAAEMTQNQDAETDPLFWKTDHKKWEHIFANPTEDGHAQAGIATATLWYHECCLPNPSLYRG